ncbi:hypothetical protein HUU05_15385 [candidate division KSB1 bacterium]|nr:hypothetical protein [candidate division KSB1 bacterium]
MKGFVTLFMLLGSCAVQIGCNTNAKETGAASTAPPMQLAFDAAQSDSAAVALADRVLAAVGEKENLDAVRYLSFRFVIKSDTGTIADWRHDWDRVQHRYRLAGTLASGEQALVFLNLNTQDGHAFLNGNPAPEDDLQNLLAMAYSRFTSDTYWLLLPFKLKDPGARLEYLGTQQAGAASFEVIRLSFIDDVGLTPENAYNIFIDPGSHEIRRWEYFEHPEARPLIAWWENWQSFGALKFALQRRLEESDRIISFEDLVVSSEVDANIFTVPAPTQAGME